MNDNNFLMDQFGKDVNEKLDEIVRDLLIHPVTSTASSNPPVELNVDVLREVYECLHVVYDRKRGDLPDNVFVLNLEQKRGIIDKIIQRGDGQFSVVVDGESFVVPPDAPLVACKLRRPQFNVRYEENLLKMSESERLLWLFSSCNGDDISYPSP